MCHPEICLGIVSLPVRGRKPISSYSFNVLLSATRHSLKSKDSVALIIQHCLRASTVSFRRLRQLLAASPSVLYPSRTDQGWALKLRLVPEDLSVTLFGGEIAPIDETPHYLFALNHLGKIGSLLEYIEYKKNQHAEPNEDVDCYVTRFQSIIDSVRARQPLPAITVRLRRDKKFLVTDGLHRFAALAACSEKSINCVIPIKRLLP